MFCDDCDGEVSTSEQDKASLKEEVKVCKYKYWKYIANTSGLQTQICAYKKIANTKTKEIPQMWIMKKHCKHKRLALQASRQTGWWREENWVLPILILASATLLLLLLFQVSALARQQGTLLLPTNPLMAFCRFCSWSNQSEEAGAVGGIWPDHTAPKPSLLLSSLPSTKTSL